MTYKDDFVASLGGIKISMILFFIIVTAIYQFQYHTQREVNTFFGDNSTRWRVLLDGFITGLLGVLSTIAVIVLRRGRVANHLSTLAIIFFLLFTFAVAQEGSGFNRFLARKETMEGSGPYAKLDGILNPDGTINKEEQAKLEALETGGDPFLTSVAYTCAIIVGVLLSYTIWKMFTYTKLGYESGKSYIQSNQYLGSASPYKMFVLELILVVGLNALAPMLAPLIRGETYTRSNYVVILGIGVVAFVLHFMLQYVGLLNFWTDDQKVEKTEN